MSYEIGMMKGPGSPGRTGPTAKAGPADPAQRATDAQQPGKAEKAEKDSLTEEMADEVAKGLNDLVHDLHRELRFSVDRDSGDTVIKVVDRQTDEVLRQIPSEEVVALRKRLEEAAGVIFQDSA